MVYSAIGCYNLGQQRRLTRAATTWGLGYGKTLTHLDIFTF